jgi:CBS domain-containing protein
LDWFGAKRRGFYIVHSIRDTLSDLTLRTNPDFESAFIDAEIRFEDATIPVNLGAVEHEPPVAVIPTTPNWTDPALPNAYSDPTQRIGKLPAANKVPTAVAPDTTVLAAVSTMMANDYSQLPVMTNERDVKGVVTWKSIGKRLTLGRPHQFVREVMDPAVIIDSDVSLFAAIDTIIQKEFVLVRNADRRIGGIVTTSDLSRQFGQLGEPFLLLGEIENHIRRLLHGRFSQSELREVGDPNASRTIESVSDLSFGAYVRLLESPVRWNTLELSIDRSVFVEHLDRVRQIRNDVMHFDPDGITNEDLAELRLFAGFLGELYSVGVE